MIEVVGNLDNLQSSIDFYLNITSTKGVSNSRFIRDRFFEIFEREDSYRKENFLVYQDLITEDYRIAENSEPELCGGECLFDEGISYFKGIEEPVLVGDEVEAEFSSGLNYFEESNDYEDEESSYFEDDYEVNEDAEEDTEDFILDDDEFVKHPYRIVSEVKVGKECRKEEENAEKVFTSEFVDDSFDDLGFFEDSNEVENFVKEDLGVKNTVVEATKNTVSVVDTIPTDLREFVKMYPNCELSFVYRYFSKKEVEKQLRLGRVFKRKNRLLI